MATGGSRGVIPRRRAGHGLSGRLITLEGIDGSGKSTLARALTKRLKDDGFRVTQTQEETRGWLGIAVKRSIKEKKDPFAVLMLFLADRAEHTLQIRKWVADGRVVVCDRYLDSSLAYQGTLLAGRVPDPFAYVRKVQEPFVLPPDLTLLLDVNPRVALERMKKRKAKATYEDEKFLTRVREAYRRVAISEGSRIKILDGSLAREDLIKRAMAEVRATV